MILTYPGTVRNLSVLKAALANLGLNYSLNVGSGSITIIVPDGTNSAPIDIIMLKLTKTRQDYLNELNLQDVSKLMNATPAQINAWVTANINTTAQIQQAIAFLATLVKILYETQDLDTQ